MEIPLSTEQPAVKQRPGSLSYNPATGRFYAEHATDETPASSALKLSTRQKEQWTQWTTHLRRQCQNQRV